MRIHAPALGEAAAARAYGGGSGKDGFLRMETGKEEQMSDGTCSFFWNYEFEAEKCRLSGANSTQGISKTKIVLSFPIRRKI